MLQFFDINTVLFTFLDYPMSYLEFFGTLFNVACVWLVVKNKIATWPVGIVGIVLYSFLFYQIQLYADLFEQMYFLVMSFYGWYIWSNAKTKKEGEKKHDLAITKLSTKVRLIYVGAIVLGTILLSFITSNLHIWLPQYFPEPASFVVLDAFTTVLSFAATILMARKKLECWYLWIVVDVIAIYLYYVKDVKFIALEYILFLVMAIMGLIQWQKLYKKHHKTPDNFLHQNAG
ncbi:MAG: nicotinamide riboside transporter PnuC [Candidatus Altimarinota bacterium]